jgi:hypothetical protein
LDTKAILKNTLEYHQTDLQTQKELIMWYDVITRKNYFTHNHDIISQHDGLAMGAPSSGLIAEFFLQHTENTHLARLAYKHRITDYFRYVDDILLIFDPNHSDTQSILTHFNTLHPNLHFTAETERDNTINYLDISIHKTPHELKNIHIQKAHLHRLHHPPQHKYAVVRFVYNRLNSFGLQQSSRGYRQFNQIRYSLHGTDILYSARTASPHYRSSRPTPTNCDRLHLLHSTVQPKIRPIYLLL